MGKVTLDMSMSLDGFITVPVLLGEGRRLFDHPGTKHIELESTRVIKSPGVTHLRFRVVKDGGNRP